MKQTIISKLIIRLDSYDIVQLIIRAMHGVNRASQVDYRAPQTNSRAVPPCSQPLTHEI